MADAPELEDAFDREFRSGDLAEPITFHPEEWPQAVGAGITTAVDGSPLRGCFGVEAIEVLDDAAVPIVTRRTVLELRAADLVVRPKFARPDGASGGHQWTIRGVVYRTIKVEDPTPGWLKCQLQRSE